MAAPLHSAHALTESSTEMPCNRYSIKINFKNKNEKFHFREKLFGKV
jgi:hypothetical protein